MGDRVSLYSLVERVGTVEEILDRSLQESGVRAANMLQWDSRGDLIMKSVEAVFLGSRVRIKWEAWIEH